MPCPVTHNPALALYLRETPIQVCKDARRRISIVVVSVVADSRGPEAFPTRGKDKSTVEGTDMQF